MARKILLADDSVTAQNMGRKILTDAGYEVVTVNNGSAALKKISECKPTVVVLDVYMPGYSGLEVCARIKEGRDTSGIPVLLTVGKLEPFRQDEARKVHADAFIIKPFEATELLAALNKLEAKAGAQPQPKTSEPTKASSEAKSSRHLGFTMARYEREVADGAPRFGDEESGWKARLTMPSPGSKHQEPEGEPRVAATSSRSIREFDREGGDRPAFTITPVPADLESSNSPQGLLQDVTPEEMAAIAAAAAAVGGSNVEKNFERLTEEPATTAANNFRTVPSASEPAAPESSQAPPSASAESFVAQVEATTTALAAAADAAIPAEAEALPEPATIAVVAGSDSASIAAGARWVAEEVPVEPAESALVLEREMQKAFAAFAAAEHGGCYEPGPVGKNDEPMFTSIAPPAIGEPTPFSQASAEAEGGAERPALAQQEAVSSKTEASLASEIALPPAVPSPPVAPAEETKHGVVAFGEPHPFEPTAGAPVSESVSEQQQPSPPFSGSDYTSTDTAVPARDDWHELRQPVAAVPASGGNGANGSFQDFKPAQELPPEGEPDASLEPAAMAAAAAGDSSTDATLSSIVDNMLAALKPKLMAELAKKLEKK